MHRLRPLILMALCLAAAAAAPAATLKWEINAGFSGFFRPGAWTPVTAILDYTTPATAGDTGEALTIHGTLEVYARSVSNKMILFERPIELPASSRQRFMFYIQLSDVDSAVEVVLRSDRGRRLMVETFSGLTPLKPTESLTLVPARNAVSLRLPVALEETVNQKSLTKLAVVDPLHLPDNWIGYSGVNLLLIPNYVDNMLTRQQVDAIADWVKGGGELWALGGQNTLNYRNQLIEELLPVELSDTWTKDWTERGQGEAARLVVSTLVPRPDARVVAIDPQSGPDGVRRPYIVSNGLGNGRVTFWAVDFAHPLFAVSPFFQACWWSLYPFEVINSHEQFFWQRFLPNMEQKMGLSKAIRFPSLLLIFLFIVIYALLVGPVNFWVLSRRRKLEWGWVTVPLIIGVFTVLIYGYALVFKGSSYLKRDFEIWRTTPGSASVKRETHSFVFSSRRLKVDFEPNNDNGSAAPYDEWDELRNQFIEGGMRFPTAALSSGVAGAGLSPSSVRDVVQTAGGTLRTPRSLIDQWAPAYYKGEAIVDHGAPLVQADLKLAGSTSLRGPLTNSSSYDYTQAFVLYNDWLFKIDDLPAGRSVVLERINAVRLNGYLGSEEAKLRQMNIDALEHYGQFVWYEMITWLTQWNQFMKFAHPSQGEAYFCAMVKAPGVLPELSMKPPPREASRHALIVCPIVLAPDAGAPLTLQGSDVRRAILYAPDTMYGEFVKHRDAPLPLSQASLTLMLDTPLGEGGRLPSEIQISVMLQPSRNEQFVFSVFNFRLGRWDRFDNFIYPDGLAVKVSDNNYNAFLPADSYGSPINGRAFVRLDSFPRSTAITFGDSNGIRDISVSYHYR